VGHDDLAWYLRWVVPLIAPYASFDNRSKISRVACPILLVQASKDQLTSAKRSDELAAAVKSGLVRVTVDADHDGSWKKGCALIEVWLQGIASGGN
jgi:fermentation-respiration switch protein FrsA (DUF1100 family)